MPGAEGGVRSCQLEERHGHFLVIEITGSPRGALRALQRCCELMKQNVIMPPAPWWASLSEEDLAGDERGFIF